MRQSRQRILQVVCLRHCLEKSTVKPACQPYLPGSMFTWNCSNFAFWLSSSLSNELMLLAFKQRERERTEKVRRPSVGKSALYSEQPSPPQVFRKTPPSPADHDRRRQHKQCRFRCCGGTPWSCSAISRWEDLCKTSRRSRTPRHSACTSVFLLWHQKETCNNTRVSFRHMTVTWIWSLAMSRRL